MNEQLILNTINTILSQPLIRYPLAVFFLVFGAILFIYIFTSLIKSYKNAKDTGKKISWFKILEDIKWTLYDWNNRDKEYVMSLPRLIYFISSILIIFVVISGKTDMLAPLLGFNLTSAASYSGKKYIETKEAIVELDIKDKEEE